MPNVAIATDSNSGISQAEATGHGDIDHLVMGLQKLLPQVRHIPRRGLGGGDIRVLRGQAIHDALMRERLEASIYITVDTLKYASSARRR